jgi:circadian clock protein KaiC
VTHKCISSFQPSVVVVDPVTNLLMASSLNEVRSMLTRLVDFLKTQEITAIFTSLTAAGGSLEASEANVSSLMDTWLLLKSIEVGGERNRALYVLKSRGMEHSNQIREFLLTNDGLRLLDVYLGAEGVLTGSARVSQEMREKAVVTFRRQELETHRRELERKRRIFEARMVMLRAEFEAEEEIIQQTISESVLLGKERLQDRGQMVLSREADTSSYKKEGRAKAARKG